MDCDISFIGMLASSWDSWTPAANSFAGLGQMGYGMATNIRKKLSKNATMFVNDVNHSACERFAEENSSYGSIKIVSTAKDTASKAPVLISIVPASQHVRQVYLDQENGVVATTPGENRLILECSTIDVETTREVGKAIMDKGIGRYIDAPVSVSPNDMYLFTVKFNLDRAALKAQQTEC